MGKLFVLEGTDGSGKSTQFQLLCERLEREGVAFQRLIFPQYSEESSALIRMYLSGQFGSHPSDVNAYAASAFYAVDRYASWKTVWGETYAQGGLILADRYTTSNAVHQAAKLPPEEREEFFRWLSEFEYDRLGLPRPDGVLFLDMPTERAVGLLRAREAMTRTKADIHEVDTDYLRLCRETALQAAEFYGWQRVACTAGQALRSVEEIHEEIWNQVSKEVLV